MADTTIDKPQAASAGRGQRVWAILLVLDAFFVIIFGGAFSAKVYQHWHAPAIPRPAPRARRDHKVTAAKPPESAPAAITAANPPQTAVALASKPIEAPPLSVPSAAKPPRPQAAAPAATAAPGYNATTKAKALATDFLIKAPGANSVELAGAFIVRGGKKAMVSHPDGTWTLTLYLTPNTYRYWFIVNGKKKLDPQNSLTDRGASVISVQP